MASSKERAAIKRRIARQQREARRVDQIVQSRLERDIRTMMRDNRAGGI